MKIILSLLLVCLSQIANAITYYFSSTTGDDTRTATQAQNQATPWKTLAKLNSIFSTLNPGDVVLLKRGDTFYGSITVTKSGTASLPITISAYGSGNKPVITGFATLTNWTAVGSGSWEAASSDLGAKVNILTIDNAVYAMGRYPNKDAANNGYLSYESAAGNTQITDNELTSGTNWTGAEVVIRKVRGVIDRNIVTSHSGSVISYASGSTYNGSANFGYFIQNDIRTLDQFGEWHFNPSTKKVRVFFGGNSPTSYNLKASAISTLINLNSQNNVVFDNLSVQGANIDAFRINGAQNVVVRNCDIAFSGENGINATITNNLKVEACTVVYSNDNAIDLATNVDNASVKYTRIENTSLFPGMGTSGDGNSTGINCRGKAITVEYCEIINTGYNGISFNDDDAVIKNNYINNFCLVKDDGGGIYTFIGNINMVKVRRKILGNIILNGVGAGAGTSDPTYLPANGIFLDDNASGVEIRDNTIANNSNYGVFFHNAHDNILANNTIYNNRSQLYMRSYLDPYGNVMNNEINGNILYSKLTKQMTSHSVSVRNDFAQFGNFNNNRYVRPLDDDMTILNDLVYNSGNSTKSDAYDLNGWKTKYQEDLSSTKSPVQIPAYIVNSASSVNKITNGTFSANIGYVNCWTPTNNCVSSWNSGGKLDGGSLQLGFTSPTGSYDVATTSLAAGNISNTKNYILKFSLLGATNGNSLAVYLRNNDTYNKVTPTKHVKITTSRTENEILFSAPINATNGGLILELNNQYNTVWIDNISLVEADVTMTNPDNHILFETNPSSTTRTVSLNGSYVDVNNNTVSNSVTIQPYSSVVLTKSTGSSIPIAQTINFGPLANKTLGDPAFTVTATASSGLPVSFRITSGPATISGNTVSLTGVGTVSVEASQAGNSSYRAATPVTQSFVVSSGPATGCTATGTILREQWNNISGWAISSIPLQSPPSQTSNLNSFESQDVGQLYGARIRGYICPPQSGDYTFWISGDDVLELWLSTDDNPSNKVKICNTNYTMFREWNKYPSQKSALKNLQAGRRYYVEVLQKEGGGGGHSSVGWTLPTGVFQAPIPGSQLSPYSAGGGAPSVPAVCTASYSILHEIWNNVGGYAIANIPLQNQPTASWQLSSLEAQETGQLFGVRIRGYICAPQSGNYTFNVSGDDVAELWLSTDDNPSNKVKICNTTSYTMFREWNKYPSQKSSSVNLQSGRRYYVEVLQKDGGGGGHVSVAWTLPNGVFQGPVPGSQLSPATSGTPISAAAQGSVLMEQITQTEDKLVAYPNPFRTTTTVQFTSPVSGNVTLELLNMQGKLIKQIYKGQVIANSSNSVVLNKNGLTDGTYVLRLVSKTQVLTKKINLVK